MQEFKVKMAPPVDRIPSQPAPKQLRKRPYTIHIGEENVSVSSTMANGTKIIWNFDKDELKPLSLEVEGVKLPLVFVEDDNGRPNVIADPAFQVPSHVSGLSNVDRESINIPLTALHIAANDPINRDFPEEVKSKIEGAFAKAGLLVPQKGVGAGSPG